MTRLQAALVVLMVAVAACLSVDPADAGTAPVTISAATFATNTAYCGDGGVTVSDALVVSGGTSGFARDHCTVQLLEKGRLNFVDVNLSGTEYFSVFCGLKCRVSFDNSSLTMSGIAITTDGSSAGGQRFSVRNNTRLESTAGAVALHANDGGVVEVEQSTLKSAGGPGDYVSAESYTPFSDSNKKGTVSVEGSTLEAGSDDIYVYSGGKATVEGATLTAVGRYITAVGKCRSEDNTPDTPCTTT